MPHHHKLYMVKLLSGKNIQYSASGVAIFHPLTGTPVSTFSTNSQSPLATGSADTPTILGDDLLYPYGPAIDGTSPESDDGSTPAIPLSIDLPIFGHNHSYVYVNNNGLLSFHFQIGQYTPQALPVAFGNPFVALFWADINNQLAGDVYYRETTDPDLLSRATSDVMTYFRDVNFTAQWAFVATWNRVAYFGSRTDKVNTFQAILCSDGNLTFVLLNYDDLQWPSVNASSNLTEGPLALAGLNSGYSTGYYTLPGSMTLDIVNLSSTSNVNVTGRWVFKVDGLHPEDVNGFLDNSTDVPPTDETPFIDDFYLNVSIPIYQPDSPENGNWEMEMEIGILQKSNLPNSVILARWQNPEALD
ncbi:sushi, nidogen and EGF-like domain-containing protein 1 [Hyperolius riggenbachi]|uniref:sushi, nidogen and EGF-like domain-containing protein 1 n=1 Tax=Hyperolius riggenbachi TaxID=752182 RepID=UPI0035A327A5